LEGEQLSAPQNKLSETLPGDGSADYTNGPFHCNKFFEIF
jgi:hypothetical protein